MRTIVLAGLILLALRSRSGSAFPMTESALAVLWLGGKVRKTMATLGLFQCRTGGKTTPRPATHALRFTRHGSRRGFTLIELLVVIAIIAILAAGWMATTTPTSFI